MYSLPSHLSDMSRDLIPQMLRVDPMKRISIGAIRQHRWFQMNLPPYLKTAPEVYAQQVAVLDDAIIEELVSMQWTPRSTVAGDAPMQISRKDVLDAIQRGYVALETALVVALSSHSHSVYALALSFSSPSFEDDSIIATTSPLPSSSLLFPPLPSSSLPSSCRSDRNELKVAYFLALDVKNSKMRVQELQDIRAEDMMKVKCIVHAVPACCTVPAC
jgi:serine/threonine protein kinase